MTTTPAPSIAASLLTGSSTGPFPTGFKYNAAEDVRVWLELAGIRQPDLTLTTDYTLTGTTPLVDGGTVTLDTGLVPEGGWNEEAGDRVVIARRTVKRQALALPDTEGHKPRSTEAALDKLMRVGEEQAEVLERAVSVPAGEEGLQLPPVANRTGGAILALTDDGTEFDLSRTTEQFDADVAQARADAEATAADREATAADREVTTADRVVTTADRAVTTADRAVTTADRAVTTADRAVTTADRAVTTADRVQTTLDATNAAASAAAAAALANMWPDEATGLANTPSGGYFSIEPDANGDIVICRDNSGVAEIVGSVFALATDHKGRRHIPPHLLGQRGQGLKLRRALSEIRAGTRPALKVMVIGDSLSGITWSDVHIQMMKGLEGWFTSTPVYAHSLGVLDYGAFSDSAACTAGSTSTTGTVREKLDYDAAWDGTLVWHDTGQATRFSIGGLSPQGDKIYIPIIREPGAGTVKIEIATATAAPALGAGSWVNPTVGQITSGHALTGSELLVNASGTFGVEMVTLSVALGPWCVKVTHTAGGRVRVRYPMHEVTTAAAYNVWRVGSASNDFVSAQTLAATIEARQIAAYDPDIIIVESDDRLAAYQNFLPKLQSAISAAGLTQDPLVLLVVNPFYANGPYDDDDIIERTNYCHTFASTRLGWDVLDGMALSGGLDESTAAGWENDGIHYSGELARWMTRTWLVSRGYLPAQPQGGGFASTAVALKGPVTTATGSQRPLIAGNIPALLLQASIFDTVACNWTGTQLPSGSGTYARANAREIVLSTGGTAGSGSAAYINQDGSLLGISQGNIRNDNRGFACRIRTTTDWDAQALAFILIRTNAVTYNSGYNGTLTGEGWGFRISNDGTNTRIHGICWLNGALVVSSSSAIMPTGATSSVKDIAVLCTPEALNPSRGTLEWFAGTTSLGTSNYDHGGVFLPPRLELFNGTTAASRNLHVMPPKLLSSPQ